MSTLADILTIAAVTTLFAWCIRDAIRHQHAEWDRSPDESARDETP